MIEAATIAAMTETQVAEYKRAATYVAMVIACDPGDRERRFGQARELLEKSGIVSITVPDIVDALKDRSDPSAPKAMACDLMGNIEAGFD